MCASNDTSWSCVHREIIGPRTELRGIPTHPELTLFWIILSDVTETAQVPNLTNQAFFLIDFKRASWSTLSNAAARSRITNTIALP